MQNNEPLRIFTEESIRRIAFKNGTRKALKFCSVAAATDNNRNLCERQQAQPKAIMNKVNNEMVVNFFNLIKYK